MLSVFWPSSLSRDECVCISSTEWTSIKFDCGLHRLHVSGEILEIIAVLLNVYLPSSVLASTWTVYLHRICHVFTFKMPSVYFHESPLKLAWFMCCYIVTMKCCVILTSHQNMTVYSVCPCSVIQMLLLKCSSFLISVKRLFAPCCS